MVDKEKVVSAINSFITSHYLETAITLIEYLAELNEVQNKDVVVKAVTANPAIISLILEKVLEELEIKLNICRVVDKNNNLILVF